jgi:hypothetical protein
MPATRLAGAGVALRGQIDRRFPARDRAADGWIGDAIHATRVSDHNPDPLTGVVRAIDVDEDLLGPGMPDPSVANTLVSQLVASADFRLRYVIFEGIIWEASRGWYARSYTGGNAHERHLHVSFLPAGDDDGTPFRIPLLEIGGGVDGAAAERTRVAIIQGNLAALVDRGWVGLDPGPIDGLHGPRTSEALMRFRRAAFGTWFAAFPTDAEVDRLRDLVARTT